jgi:hypothetical protein
MKLDAATAGFEANGHERPLGFELVIVFGFVDDLSRNNGRGGYSGDQGYG